MGVLLTIAAQIALMLGIDGAIKFFAKKFGAKAATALVSTATKAGATAGGKMLTAGLEGSVKKLPGAVGKWMPGSTGELIGRTGKGLAGAAMFAAPMMAFGMFPGDEKSQPTGMSPGMADALGQMLQNPDPYGYGNQATMRRVSSDQMFERMLNQNQFPGIV